MKKFLLISPKNRTVYNFRGDLIRSLREDGYEVVVTGPDRTDVERIEALGVTFLEVPMQKNGTSILEDLKYLKRLVSVMRSVRPDVTLGYTVKPAVYGALAAKWCGVKNRNSMVTGAGYAFTAKGARAKVIGTIVKVLYRMGLSAAHHVIFQNADDREEFVQRKLVCADKCKVVNGSGVNMEWFTPAPLPDGMQFFMLSRLLKSKGVTEYLKACRIVKERYPNVRFSLLGKYETSMQDAVSREEVEAYVKEGIVDRYEETSDVRPYYAACNVFVLPSYREGTPRTVLEAMAMGRAILTTETNGCRETVEHGKNGYLVPIRDEKALAKRMIELIEHPERVEQMGKESLRYCREKFDSNVVNEQMKEAMKV